MNESKYSLRMKKDFTKVIIFFLVILLLSFLVSQSFLISIISSLFASIVFFVKSLRWNKYYILEIGKKGNRVVIKYLDREIEKKAAFDLQDLTIKKRFSFSTGRVPFLFLSNSENFRIFQYEIGDWNEEKFDNLIKKINEYKLI